MRKIKSERFSIFKKLYPFIKPQKHLYIALGGFKIYFLLLSLITPVFYMLLINDVMIDKKLSILVWVVLGYVGLYLLKTLGTVLNKKFYNTLFIKFNLKLKIMLLTVYTKMETKHYNKYDAGDLKNRIDNDISIFEKFFNSHCLEYVYSIISAVVISGILLYMNWMLALFGFVMVPLSFLFAKIMGKKAGKVANEYRKNYGRYEGFLHFSLQNWKEIKANSLEENEVNILTKHWDKLSKLFVKRQVLWYINRGFIAFKDFFITKMNLYFLGGIFIINGNLSVGELLVFMSYYEQFFSNISKITDLILGLKTDKPSIDRVLEIIDYKTPEKLKVKDIEDKIEVKEVSFKYNDTQKKVLNNINIKINSREHIAVAGRSGCGKTTLAKLLLGLYEPDSGVVNIGGYNIQDISTESIGKKISIVMQDPVLFNLSIKENLLFAKRRAEQNEIDMVCKQADIFEFIQSLPDKYDTVIGERGIKLSGGQKQRLAIARTMLFNPDIIIFDEATSSLDNESEKAILNSIKMLSEEKTIITIAHRLSSVIASDKVFIMDNGKIVGSGTHNELKNKNEIYDLLFLKQYKVG